MSVKSCIKCGHGVEYEGVPPAECAKCGAIYSKVEQAFSTHGDSMVRNVSSPKGAMDLDDFAAKMRDQSQYPVFRTLVGLGTLVGYALAVIVAIGSFVVMRETVMAGLFGLCFAVVIAIFAKAGKEISLMLADLADAAVRLAARSERSS